MCSSKPMHELTRHIRIKVWFFENDFIMTQTFLTEIKFESIARILSTVFNLYFYFKICITLPSKLELQEIHIYYMGLFIKCIQT
jgi:hypothetical protein